MSIRVHPPKGLVLLPLPVLNAHGQIQEAWVARYNNGLSNRQHQAVAMALDTNGNIYVTGSSQRAAGNYDYATIKYSPNGVGLAK